MPSNVIRIRTDASEQIGSGHVMRSLALARALRTRGQCVEFICRPATGDCIHLLKSEGFGVHRLAGCAEDELDDAGECALLLDGLEQRSTWLIVDHYRLGRRWESHLRQRVDRICVIDDLANRQHDCDLLLDQNLYPAMEKRYVGLVPSSCKLFLGPEYALLRNDFRVMKSKVKTRQSVQRLLISMGGADIDNITTRALAALSLLRLPDIAIDVVVGGANPHAREVKERCAFFPNAFFHFAVEGMAALIATADMGIGAGGISLWERCYLGLPTVAVSVADNQSETLRAADAAGCVVFLGNSSDIDVEQLANAVDQLYKAPRSVRKISEACLRLMPGNDGEDKLLEAILDS